MRFLPKKSDNQGKEAFAYLAVVLMVISTGYISFITHIEINSERGSLSADEVLHIEQVMDSTESDMRQKTVEYHDLLFTDILSRVNGTNFTRTDCALEGKLISELEGHLECLIDDINSRNQDCTIIISDLSISVSPLEIRQSMPSVAVKEEAPNGTGTWTYGIRPGTAGVTTNIRIDLEGRSKCGDILSKRSLEIFIERNSTTDILAGRISRLEKALSGPELTSLFEHIISSLARAKAFLGAGRAGTQTSATGSILTDGEISSCLDLSVHLLSQAYLGTIDLNGLSDVEQALVSERDSQSCCPGLIDLLEDHHGPFDPAILVLLKEGLFSETCPPSAEEILRPLFLSVLQRCVLDLFNFLGVDTGILGFFDGYFDLFLDTTNLIDDISETLLGRKLIDAREKAAKELLYSFYPDDMNELKGKILIGKVPGVLWNGEPIVGYPEVRLDSFTKEINFWISNNTPGSTQVNPIEVEVVVRFDFPAFEPSFMEFDLVENGDGLDGLSSALGMEDDCLEAESIFKDYLSSALRDSIEDLISSISEEGDETWNEIWKGWTYDDHPVLNDEMEPVSSFISFTSGSFLDISRELLYFLLKNLDIPYASDLLERTYWEAGSSIANWLYREYHRIINSEELIRTTTERDLQKLALNANVEVLSTNLIDPQETNTMVYEILTEQEFDEVLGDGHELFKRAFYITGHGWDSSLVSDLMSKIRGSLNETMEREVAPWNSFNECGFLRKQFQGITTRGGYDQITGENWFGDLSSFGDRLVENLEKVISGISQDISGLEAFSGSRYFLPNTEMKSGFEVFRDSPAGIIRSLILPSLKIMPNNEIENSLKVEGGIHDIDPRSESSSFRTDFELITSRSYQINYSTENSPPIERSLPVSIRTRISTYTPWPIDGAKYHTTETLMDMAKDKVKEASRELISEISNVSFPLISSLLPSLRDVPPIIMDLVENKHLDLSEISRVITNISMDLSSTLREGVKCLIKELTEEGLTSLLSGILSIMNLEGFTVELDLGPIDLELTAEKEALSGGEGSLIKMVLDVHSIGLNIFLEVTRIQNSTITFNATALLDRGPLRFRIEMDPLMESRPHLLSRGLTYFPWKEII
jgi:hypothetical protein